ncbi:GNAT family N-acetyltransferase [soil metagenome]
MNPPTGYNLRSAINADGEAVREVVFAALREHGIEPSPEDTDLDLYAIEQHYAAIGGSFDVLVENQSDQIVGTVGLHPEAPGTVELRKMYLHAAHRGRGCGRYLLEHALAGARQLGFSRVVLETTFKLPKAIAIYRACGFQPYTATHCAPRCDLTMELYLNPP